MKTNVALVERTFRMGFGMLLLVSPLLELPTYPFNLLGLVLIVTAGVGYCPLYSLFSAFRPSKSSAPLRVVKPEAEGLPAHSRAR